MTQLKILEFDPWLRPFEHALDERYKRYLDRRKRIAVDGSLKDFANGYMFYGFHKTDKGWFYREWAPNANSINVFGDFNDWNRTSHPLTRVSDTSWEIYFDGVDTIKSGSKVRIQIVTKQGETLERIPLYAKRVIQDPVTFAFDGQIWEPDNPYQWQNMEYKRDDTVPLLIYESHVGMAGEEEKVSTFKEFTEFVIPRVKRLGYNTIQLMAIMEHPYYGSFGYQVSNFFAVSSRFGTPEDLKELVDTAHKNGIAVLLDLVHSHAAKNEVEGIARFDGTDYQFFHAGPQGRHPQWDSMLFDYGKNEVLHFLLSNLKFWLDEYHFDGFRFDGVTSMLYKDHGIGEAFTGYSQYFSNNTDNDAILYLQLATDLCHEIHDDCILIAEDMSGMPGMCIPIDEGGIGFDYRLGMGVPDYWIKLLKERNDEDWDVGNIWYELTQRRPHEKVVGYSESHDQALVGDKTIMFRLADKEMYTKMDNASESLIIDRAIALHKLIRLITCMTAGEAYLNFMGNEFGHPEWIDFPRQGNNNSYHYARRQWSLAENGYLKYKGLEKFDIEMLKIAKEHDLLFHYSKEIWTDNLAKVLAFRKDKLLFLFNFNPIYGYETQIPIEEAEWEIIMNTNWKEFSGYADKDIYTISTKDKDFMTHLDKRSALVYRQL